MTGPRYPNTARAVHQYTQHGQQRVGVLHFVKPAGSITDADLEALGEYLNARWEDLGRQACSNQLGLEQIQVTNIDPAGGNQFTLDRNPPSYGSVTAGPAPGNSTHTASFRTRLVGRSKRGRNYLPGLVDAWTNDDDTVHSDRLMRAAAWVASWFTGLPSGWELVVASPHLLSTEAVTTIVFENILDSMRKRLPGRGR